MSNYIGYKQSDNARRKSNNIETGNEFAQSMARTKKWGGSGVSAASREAQELRRKSKQNPVKIYTPEEIEELNKSQK